MSTSWQSWLSRLAGAAFTMPLKAIAKKKIVATVIVISLAQRLLP